MLNSRYDDVKSGVARPVKSEEVFGLLKAKTETRRKGSAWAALRARPTT